MRTILFHNPKAGAGEHSEEELVAALRIVGLDVRYCSTKSGEFKKALQEPAELVVVAGGDGTVAKVLTQWPDRSVPIGIVPLGTANNIATSLGIAGEAEDLAPFWSPEHTRPLNVGIASGPWGEKRFIEAVGLGALARSTDKKVGANSDGEKRLLVGRAAFCDALRDMPSLNPGLVLDGKAQNGAFLAVELLNLGHVGPRLPLAPAADPGDGMLDIACIGIEGRDGMLDWLATPHEEPAPLDVVRARKVTFDWDGEEPLRIDDDFPDAPKDKQRITVELEPEPLKILVARKSDTAGTQAEEREKDE